jgi:hypothetical protein
MVLGQFQFGAYPVGAGHQQRLLQTPRQAAEACEPPQSAPNLGPVGAFHAAADAFHESPPRHHINPGVAVIHSRAAGTGSDLPMAATPGRHSAPWKVDDSKIGTLNDSPS